MRFAVRRICITAVLCCGLSTGALQAACSSEGSGGSHRAAVDFASESGSGSNELYPRRLPRVNECHLAAASSDAAGIALPFNVSASLARWKKNFANPVVCNMIFCHSSCADYDDSCPSFRRPLLQNFFDQNGGCLSQQNQPTRAASHADHVSSGDATDIGENCCTTESNSETFSSARSQLK